jgi:predicted nicotinamide N-methyase
MPIVKKNTAQHSNRFFGVELLKSTHPSIKKLKREYPTSIHGNKFWGSSYLLMDYFKKNPLNNGDRVLELGCGWGLASIYLNKKYACDVTGADADADVFPYLALHAEVNKAQVKHLIKRFEKITKKELAEYDVIIAADVCFWDELGDIHYKLIKRAIAAGVKKIVYADPERAPFLHLAERCTNTLFAELHEKELKTPVKARGALMVIENA